MSRRSPITATADEVPAARAPIIIDPSPRLRDTLVVVGNGMVGHRLCRELAARRAVNRHAVVVFGEEPVPAYDRVHLTDCLAGRDTEALLLSPREWYEEQGIELLLDDPVVAIDRSARQVLSASGMRVDFDRLVLATGSRPFVPPIDGAGLPGVLTYRTLADAAAIREQARSARTAAVIGGGLLGLESARALQRCGVDVTVIEVAGGLLPAQLDQRGSNLLARQVAALGIRVMTGMRTGRIEAAGTRRVLHLAGGGTLAVDMVVIAAGIRPRSELAARAGLRLDANGGIVVDDDLVTSDPRIHAIGECAAHRSGSHGLVAPGYAMADALAARLSGGSRTFVGAPPATRLKLLEIDVSAAGNALEGGPTAEFERDGTYRRIRIAGGRIGAALGAGRLEAALGVGAWPDFVHVQDAVRRRARVWPWQVSRFTRTGTLWRDVAAATPVADWPASTIVCTCLRVTRGQLTAAQAQGCQTTAALATCTGASSVCGSCAPLLAELAGARPSSVRPRVPRVLATASAVALALAVAYLVAPPISFASAVTASPVEALWRIGPYRQISGFVLLGLCAIAGALTLRKRIRRISFGGLSAWRTVHAVVGMLTIVALAIHTGMRLGANLNLALASSFLVLGVVGTLAGGATALEQRVAARGGPWRRALVLAHIVAIWPLPILVAFHVLAVYYF